MEKTCQVSDTCKRKLKPKKQTSIFKHKTLINIKKRDGEKPKIVKCLAFDQKKLKFRKKTTSV